MLLRSSPLVLLLLASLTGCSTSFEPVIHSHSRVGYPAGEAVVVNSAAEYAALEWHGGAPPPPLPEGFDFSTSRLAVVGRSLTSGSHRVVVDELRADKNGYTVVYRTKVPAGNGPVTTDMSSGTVLVELPADARPVAFEPANRP